MELDNLDQQDAHEFLRLFLGKLDDELQLGRAASNNTARAAASGTSLVNCTEESGNQDGPAVEVSPWQGGGASYSKSIIEDIFGGTMRSSVRCEACETVSSCDEKFHDLMLGIPSQDEIEMLVGGSLSAVQSGTDEADGENTELNLGWSRLAASATSSLLSFFSYAWGTAKAPIAAASKRWMGEQKLGTLHNCLEHHFATERSTIA